MRRPIGDSSCNIRAKQKNRLGYIGLAYFCFFVPFSVANINSALSVIPSPFFILTYFILDLVFQALLVADRGSYIYPYRQMIAPLFLAEKFG